eukprot:3480678-Karenia_brevis.AAC.1
MRCTPLGTKSFAPRTHHDDDDDGDDDEGGNDDDDEGRGRGVGGGLGPLALGPREVPLRKH